MVEAMSEILTNTPVYILVKETTLPGAIINENQPGDNPSIFQSFIFPFQLQNWWRISVEIIIIHCLTLCRAGAYNE